VVLGRRTFDIGVGIWGDVPFPAPCFVVTHSPREDLPRKSGTFAFVPDIATAVGRAKEASSGDVLVMGGGTIVGETLRAGLADEVWVQLVPVLLGAGNPMFPAVPGIELKLVEHAASPGATHLRYLVVR
jgi:dihydrofolate reductase